MRKPILTVIMPAYNAKKYISFAIESVLNQTYEDFEFLIIDDRSTDGTSKIIRNYAKQDKRIRIINNKKNMQIAYCLNKGLKSATGTFIARMDPDDISMKKRLEKQLKFLIRNPNVAIVGANIEIIDKNGKKIASRKYPSSSTEMKKIMFRYSPFAHPVIMFRKKVFEKYGGYNEAMVPCEDIDLWFKIGSRHKFATLQENLLQYRLLEASNSHSRLRYLENLGLKIKLNAIINLNYKPSFYDIVFNIFEYGTLWFMPVRFRIFLYNLLRNKGLI